MDSYYEDGGAIVTDPNNNSVIWCGGGYNTGSLRIMSVSRSTNLGATWQRYGLTTGAGFTYAVAVAPGNSSLVFASGCEGTAAAVYKTTNGGGLWVSSSSGISSDTVYDIAVHPVNAAIVFAGTRHGLYKTTNGGATWVNKGCTGVRAILFDPGDPTTLYAGTSGGVYKSPDTGETWTAMNAGLRDSCITSLGIYPGTYLFAGSREDGMYRSPLTPSAVNEASLRARLAMRVFPNPTANETNINFHLPMDGPVTCMIYDLQGRVVDKLIEAVLPAGDHALRWGGVDEHGRMVAAGVYVLAVQTGSMTDSRPLIIVR